MRRRRADRSWVHAYTATVSVPCYPPRVVTAEFDHRIAGHPEVYADGPTTSPHRYPGRGRSHLCIWYPSDPPELRWVPEDGLLRLFGMAQTHLFKEGWWRETGEWVGDEAPHAVRPDRASLDQASPDPATGQVGPNHPKADTL